MAIEEWLHHIGAALGAGGSGLAGYVISHFKTIEKNSQKGIRLAENVRSELDELKRKIEDITQESEFQTKESISHVDLTVEGMQGQIEVLRRELQTTREQLQSLQQEFKSYTNREVEKWTDLIKDVAEIRGILRDPNIWKRR